ncbi:MULTISPECIES: sensor histidine kinase [Catenuloplanes]|uniref:Sensor-like histidine kinase SenX3 n=1 Tax=Catenuloplanes niger TaxID=587534 RepID=A0AAE3ZXE3_9ACTN|nr:HAMP domain-containing sensor histidine kinase [Catenuloplanes niger]MDR7326601.1 signal transduction histidine kinase [Catenuloplanes niger]
MASSRRWWAGLRARAGLGGEGPRAAARQAAVLLAISGLVALLALAAGSPRTGTLVIIAATDLGSAALVWLLPWSRWPPPAPIAVTPFALGVLGFSTWAFGGVAAGTGPFFVLFFAWLGLHFAKWVTWLLSPVAAVCYVVPLLLTGQPPDVVGSVAGLMPVAVGVALVINERVEAQRRALDELAGVERWRRALTSAVAHDVRSPLSTIQLVLEMIRDGDLPPDRRNQFLDSALRQSARLSRLASGLLDLDRVESRGTLRLELTSIVLRRACRDATGFLNLPHVVVGVPPDLTVCADPQRLEQILVNLIGNAAKYGAAPIEITAGPGQDGMVRLAVRDHGAGVSEAGRARLFARFGTSGDVPGAVGLGLWLVRELARAHGGDIRYEDASPGARFIVTLPSATG